VQPAEHREGAAATRSVKDHGEHRASEETQCLRLIKTSARNVEFLIAAVHLPPEGVIRPGCSRDFACKFCRV